MFELCRPIGRRAMAMLLVFAMMFAMLGDYAPTWFRAAAEEVSEDSGISGSEGRSADGRESSSSDSGSSDSHESPSPESGSSDSHESPSPESGSSDSHETPISDSEPSDVDETPISDSEPSDVDETPIPDSADVWDASQESDSADATEAPTAPQSEPDSSEAADAENEGNDADAVNQDTTSEDEDASGDLGVPEMDTDDLSTSGDTGAEDVGQPVGVVTVTVPAEMPFSEEAEQAFETVAYTAPAVLTSTETLDGAQPQVSVLQNMVDETLASVTGTLSGRLQVILTRNTTYEGDVTIFAGDRTVADDFALELTAEDAGEDGMKGEGYTTVDGTITIRGIKVVMNSVMMSDGRAIKVISKGALEYNGSENAINKLEVSVGQDSSAEINTAGAGDTLNVTAQDYAKSVSINAGGGLNTVNAIINGGDFSIVTGDDSDSINVELQRSGLGAVYVDAGEGVDTLSVTDNGHAEKPVTWEPIKDEDGHIIGRKLVGGVYITSGAGDDTVDVDVRADAGDITVDTGLGMDTVSVSKGDHRTAETIDYTKVYNPEEKINDNATSVVTFINSDSDAVDRMTVDVSASDAIGGIAMQGGQGVSVHLRGTLAETEAPISGSAARLELTGEHGNRLYITTLQGPSAPVYNFTDALKNKRTVYVYADETGDFTYDSATDDFTNYVFATPVNGLTSITVTGSNRPLLLSNVVLDSEETKDVIREEEAGALSYSEEYLKVNRLTAGNLNVLLRGKSIEIGDVTAQNVRAESVQGISTLFEALTEIGNSNFDLENNSAFENTGVKQMVADMISLSDSASIDVRGKVTAVNDVALLARVKQFGDIFALMPKSLNFVNLKLASAKVHIAETAELTAQAGSVVADAKIQTTTGENIAYDEDGVGTPVIGGPPLSVTWVTDEASVTVDKGARLRAAEDILLQSRTDIKVTNNALSGVLYSPVAMAFTWIGSTVDTDVRGDLEAGHNVFLYAGGDISDETAARRLDGIAGASGGFVAINIVNQDVNAVIGEGARVKAGGDVAIYTDNLADAQTIAASSGVEWKSTASALAFLNLFNTVLGPIMEQVGSFFKDDYYTRKVERMLKKIAAGNYRVNVVDLSAENAEKGSASVAVKLRKDDEGGEAGNDHLWAVVDAKPKAGYVVGKVQYRYLEAGEDHYTYKTVEQDDKGRYAFLIDHTDMEVIVTYAEAQANGTDLQLRAEPDDDFEDVFDLSMLFGDVADSVGGSADDDDDFQIDDDVTVHNSHPLGIENPAKGGKVVTWLTGDDEGNIDTLYGGQKVRFVPNPDAGMAPDTLTVIYNEEGPDGYEITKKVTVAADSRGRWYFTVPEELANGIEIVVSASFKADTGKKEPPAHNQATGALAVGVLLNGGNAAIEPGSTVEAGGMIDMLGTKRSVMNNQADGTAITGEGGGTSDADKPQQTQLTKYSIPGVDYAVKAESTLPGTLSGEIESFAENASHPKLIFKPDAEDWASVKVIVSYYTKFNANPMKGSLWSSEVTLNRADLKPDESGAYTYVPDLGEYAVVNGTTMQISLVFMDQGGNVMTAQTGGAQEYLVHNPIRISNNALTEKDSAGKRQVVEIGKVNYVRTEGSKYYIRLAPEDGYKVDAMGTRVGNLYFSNKDALYASWRAMDGTLQRFPLKRTITDAADEWFFDVEDGNISLPEGALVTIGATFIEDIRELVVPEDAQEKIRDRGSVNFSRSGAKAGDEVTVTLSGKQGWYGSSVTVAWSEIDASGLPKPRSETFNPDAWGKVTITMPKMADGESLKVTPSFSQRIVGLNVRGSSGAPDTSDKSLSLSETSGMGYAGEIITVSPSAELAKQGYRVTEIKVQFNDDTQQIIPSSNDTFTITEAAESSGNLYITGTMALREIEVNPHTDAAGLGRIEPEWRRADKGDLVMVDILPKDGYRVKAGTLKAQIETRTGARQIVLDYEGPNRYSFTMPGGEEMDAAAVVNLIGEFEPGSDGVALSLGVAVAVGVSKSENSVEIRGGKATTGTGIAMNSVSLGNSATTEAKAGFNKGNTGLAGAIAVQVASATTTEAIRRDDAGFITVRDGAIVMTTRGLQSFKVTGDASGKAGAEAAGVGVGAGIAFAVNSVTDIAEIEDGVRLDSTDSGAPASHLTDIIISISRLVKDKVTGKAGAIGGSAFVPVAAVDVFSTKTAVKLGSLDLSAPQAAALSRYDAALTENDALYLQNILPLAGQVKLKAASDSARVQYNHDVAADASARGGDTALGGAFIVSWIDADTSALMNQSVSAPTNVSLNTSSGEALRAIATAAVSGGDKGKKSGKGGSADSQANRMMGGAGKVAGKYGGMDGARLQNDAKGRQKAETAEGSIAGAGAFVLNVQRNAARSEIMDGVDVTAAGKLTVKSANRTEAFVKANASSVKSDTGVGVGVALNIVTMENIARIGNGRISAGELELAAVIAKEATMVRTQTIAENASNFETQLNARLKDAIRAFVGEEDYEKIEWMVGPESTFFTTLLNKLVKDLNLSELLNIASDGSMDNFAHLGEMICERLEAFPESLSKPLWTVLLEADATLSGWDEARVQRFVEDVYDSVTTQVAGTAAEILKKTVMNSVDSLLASAMNMVTDKIKGNGWTGDKLKEQLGSAMMDALKDFTDGMIREMVKRLHNEIPVLTENNVELIKKLKDTTFTELRKQFLPYVTRAFREQVYDYEPLLVRIEGNGFAGFLEREIRDLLKEATVAATNEALEKLVGKLEVAFEREAISDRHVITTQAISGAGAKTTTVAGSVAIAVANLTTTAELAGGTDAVTVGGNTIVNAEELRRIRTHATAAVDEKGEADNNAGAGNTEKHETGGGSAGQTTVSRGNVTVTTGVGGSATFDESASEDNPVVWLDVQKGCELIEGETFIRNYRDASGAEIVDTVTVHKGGDDYFIAPFENIDIADVRAEDLKALEIGIDIEFAKKVSGVTAPQVVVTGEAPQPKDGAVTVSVEGGVVDHDLLMAEYGQQVKLTVDPAKAKRVHVSEITYSYRTTKDGKTETHTGTLSEGQIVRKTANASETVYVFSMPEAEVFELKVTFDPGDEKRQSESEAQDAAGRSVGVGAAFALTYGNSDVAANIGARAAGVTAGTLAVTASSDHQAENYATAGTDPFAGVDQGEGEAGKDIGVDASIAINMLDNAIEASIAEGTPVTTTATGKGDEPADEGTEISVTPGALIVHAVETGANETKGSAFATGSATAVGASVAVNVSLSDIKASLGSGAKAAGRAVVRADSMSEDRTWSFASALGADVQRALNKVADGAKATAETANSLTTGEYFDKKAGDEEDKKKATETSKRITERLNLLKAADGDAAAENLPVAANLLRSQGAVVENGDDANQAGQQGLDQVNEAGDQQIEAQENPNEKKKLQVAATVGVTVAIHSAAVTVGGAIDAGGEIELAARNAGNFNTRSTAAAMTTEEGPGKTIAAAVGISVNDNSATVEAKGDLKAKGDLTVAADLTQNMDGAYPGLLAVQALSGSVSGKGAEYSIAGAVGALVSHATSAATVENAGRIEGKAVKVIANDKSKLAVRAGGVNVSRGANVGMGISVATIWSGDTVKANVGDGATVNAVSFELAARKQAVTIDDYVFPLSWQDLISDTSALNDDERKNVYTGLIDIHKKPGEVSYTVDVNMDTYALMKIPNMLNFLSATNYYTEAVAGSLVMGSAGEQPNKLNGAGSISIVRAANSVNTALGNDVTILNDKAVTQSAKIESIAETNARILGGAVSAGPAQNGAGVTLTFLYDEDAASTDIGSAARIEAGSVELNSNADTAVQTFNAAAGVNTGDEGRLTLGGAVNVLVLRNSAKNSIGDGAAITSKGNLAVTAGANMDLKLVSVGVSGARKGTAAGGTLTYIDDGATSEVNVGSGHAFNAAGDVSVAAVTKDKLLSVLASASASLATEGKSYAAAINVMRSGARGTVTLGGNSAIKSTGGSVDITGVAGSTAINVTVAAAGSGGRAIGASVNANFYDREAGVALGGEAADYTIEAAKDVRVTADGDDTTVMAALAAAGSTDGAAIGGNLPILASANTVETKLARTTVTAGGEAAFASHLRDRTYAIAGSIALANGGNAVGATALLSFKNNKVTTDMGASTVTVSGYSGELSDKLAGKPVFKGLYVGATDDNTVFVGAAGVALSSERGITGNIVTLSSANTVLADASNASLTAAGGESEASGGDVTVDARNDNYLTLFAGGVNFGLSTGVGASLAVLTSENDVRAKARDIDAFTSAIVNAGNDEHIIELNVNAGGSGKTAVELGASIQSIRSRVNAEAAGAVSARNGSLDLKANNTTDLTNVSVALAGAAKYAVTPVFVATVFGGESNATLNANTVNAKQGVNIAADSQKNIDQYTIGASFAGEAALSGAVSIVSIKDQTNALAGSGVDITANTLDVTAASDYALTGASAAVSGGKIAGAVNGQVNIVKASTLAEMGGKATLSGAASVKARSNRDLVNVAATVGAGETGVGITVMALIAGDRLDDDAADMLTYGSAQSKNDGKTFDAAATVQSLKDMGVDTSSLEEQRDAEGKVTQTSLSDDLTGNGQRMSNTEIGDGQQFDASSGYISDDLYHGGDGADATHTESKDLKQARTVGSSAYTEDPQDAVNARISDGAVISAYGVDVEAEQETLADLYGATVGAGATTGVGISFSTAMLRSNVFATSLGDIDAHEQAVNVNAISRAGEVTPKAGSSEEQRMKSLQESLGDAFNLTKRSIRAIGLAVGGAGTVAGAVTAGVMRLDNITEATLGRAVNNAGAVTVNADSKYDDLLAATLAVSVSGEMSVGGSIAAVGTQGRTQAKLDSTASIFGAKPEVSVTTNSVTRANTVAAAVAVSGGGAVAAGFSAVVDDLTQNTLIEGGARIESTTGEGKVAVTGISDTEANTFLTSVDVGTVAVGLSGAYTNVKPTQETTVGVHGAGPVQLKGIKNLDINNDITSKGESGLASISVGYGALQGSVMLVFNDTKAIAKAGNVSGDIGEMYIRSQPRVSGRSRVASAAGGVFAIGVSVNYVDIASENTAEIDMDSFTAKVGSLHVIAGLRDTEDATSAYAESIAGGIGGAAVGVNTAIARNRATSNAIISGRNDLNADEVQLGAWGSGIADASLTGASLGGVRVVTSVLSAVNETTGKATLKLGGRLNGSLDVSSQAGGKTNAALETGGGALIGIDVNVASAYGRSNSLIDVDMAKAPAKPVSITIRNEGADDVNTSIDNMDLGALHIGTMVGVAHSQDVFDTKVKLSGGSYDLSAVDIRTSYNTTTQSAVAPSSAGVKISGATLDINCATATNTVDANTELALENAQLKASGKVNVYTDGSADVTGWIKPASFQLDALIGVGANRANADLSATQKATVRLNNSAIETVDDINVKSVVHKANTLATISTSGTGKGGKDSLHISPVSVETNKAVSKEQMNNSASIIGGGANDNSLKAKSLWVFSGVAQDAQTTTTARTDGGENITFVSVGNLEGAASSSDNYTATLQGFSADISGDASVTATTNMRSQGVGYAPGNVSLYSKRSSKIDAGIGAQDGRQTAKVNIGENVRLAAQNVILQALNTGYSEAVMKGSSEKTMLRVDDASQPTHSWYDTAVVIGDGAQLTSRGAMDVLSQTEAGAKSNFESKGMALLVNAGTMKGENNVDDTNQLTIGKGAALQSGGDMNIRVDSTAKADARTKFNADYGIYGGQTVRANNKLTRTVGLVVDEGASLSSDGNLTLSSIIGKGDSMETHADQIVFVAIDTAEAYGELSSKIDNTLDIRGGVAIAAKRDVNIVAQNSGVTQDGYNGYYTRGNVDSDKGFDFIDAPEASAKSSLNFNATININADSSDRTNISSNDGQILVLANNEGLHSETKAEVLGVSFAGFIEAHTSAEAQLKNLIKVNNTTFNGKAGTSLRANFGEDYIAYIHTWTRARLYSATSGTEETDSTLSGRPSAIISTDNRQSVEGGDNFTHEVRNILHHSYEFVTDGGANVFDIEDGSDTIRIDRRCDLCDNKMATATPIPNGSASEGLVNKALLIDHDILVAKGIFVLDVEALLNKDVRLDSVTIEKYRLWTNVDDDSSVYLLPNAARLYALSGLRLQYVADVLLGDVRGSNALHGIDVVTALTREAFENPIIPVGREGLLDFGAGVFTLTEDSDFEMVLSEVSGAWLIDELGEGVTEDGEIDGNRLYWLGDTPETAADPDQPLVYLLVNLLNDEVTAWRTSVNLLNRDAAPISVSLYLYRDSEADRMGEEKYTCVFFDTPAGGKSLLKLATRAREGEAVKYPKALRIKLRSFAIEGADLPAYAINDHFFVMCNGSDGEVSLFDDAYRVSFDGNNFSSDYTWIEGIADGELKIILRNSQNIWPEWTGETSAVDIQGNGFVRIDNVWYNANEQNQSPANAAAA